MSSGERVQQAAVARSEGEVVAICFHRFAPYHVDRIAAASRLLDGQMKVIGVEYSENSTTYAWEKATSRDFERITLFPAENWEEISPLRRLRVLMACLMRIKAKHVFLINYAFADTFAAAIALRLMGKFPYIMMGSKFSDKNRILSREAFKRFLFIPYVGGITSGASHAKYLEFLGVGTNKFRAGLDTLSVKRVRACSGSDPAPGGYEYDRRHFTIVARMIPEKDIPTAIHAYARYRDLSVERGLPARDLVLCGDGPDRSLIEDMVREKKLRSVIFLGFSNEKEVCETLASTLALILPSISETWGLVINEAVAMGVPVLCSDVCGACDDLVRAGINGYSFAPGEAEGLSNLMLMLSSDEEEWRRLAQGSLQVAPQADAARFAEAVLSLVQPRSRIPLIRRHLEDEAEDREEAEAEAESKASAPPSSAAAARVGASAQWPALVTETVPATSMP